jgi:hypothetical protein
MNYSTNEELTKTLSGAVSCGSQIICVDNANNVVLDNNILDQINDRDIVQLRPFKQIDYVINVPYSGIVLANGNGLVIGGDSIRRDLPCYLDAKMERPELRPFESDYRKIIARDRVKYIQYALTIVLAYRHAGMPDKLSPLASYEEWSDNVRSPLVWLGETDPLLGMDKTRELNPKINDRKNFMRMMQYEFLGDGKTVNVRKERDENVIELKPETFKVDGVYFLLRELIAKAVSVDMDARSELHELLRDICGVRGIAELDTDALGKWFRSNADQPTSIDEAGPMVIAQFKKTRTGVIVWGFHRLGTKPDHNLIDITMQTDEDRAQADKRPRSGI